MATLSLEADRPPCSKCNDTGWLKGEADILLRCPQCKPVDTQDWFAGLKEYPGNSQAIAAAKAFASAPEGWLVLTGGVGTGKTRLLSAIVSQWRGRAIIAPTSAELLDRWRTAMDSEQFNVVFHGYCSASAFVLDDLGAEKGTDWAIERLQMFLDHRYGRAMPTVIATNCDMKQMAYLRGDRIADRVFDQRSGLVRVITLDVPSFRTGVRT